MNIIIFPGSSTRNKEWADGVEQAFVGVDGIGRIYKHYYKHWETGEAIDFEGELKRFAEAFDTKSEPHIVCAKSIGTRVAMIAVEKGIIAPDKVVFCGMPALLIKETWGLDSITSFTIPATILQNDGDPVTSYQQLVEIIGVQPNFTIIETKGAHHDYVDFELIKNFAIQKATQ